MCIRDSNTPANPAPRTAGSFSFSTPLFLYCFHPYLPSPPQENGAPIDHPLQKAAQNGFEPAPGVRDEQEKTAQIGDQTRRYKEEPPDEHAEPVKQLFSRDDPLLQVRADLRKDVEPLGTKQQSAKQTGAQNQQDRGAAADDLADLEQQPQFCLLYTSRCV